MADSGHSTATLRLTVGTLRIAHPITVPTASVPAAEIVPALQGLVNAVVEAAEAGHTISCRKGCGACCRQLVPVSRTEGERLLQLVKAMPADRREALSARFAAAEAAIDRAGLKERGDRSDRELSVAYFAQGIACPFLEDESCSIHPERPLVCREYLVTSTAGSARLTSSRRSQPAIAINGSGAAASNSPSRSATLGTVACNVSTLRANRARATPKCSSKA